MEQLLRGWSLRDVSASHVNVVFFWQEIVATACNDITQEGNIWMEGPLHVYRYEYRYITYVQYIFFMY